jgi:DNA invertase Pin-like site-specific DNA recombinase
MTARALIYTRISKDDPEVEATADQERRCRDLAAREGYDVVAVYADDGISAFSGKDRPAWRELHGAILAGDGDIVLAVDMDRFSRDTIELLTFAVLCAKQGARWHTANGSRVDPSKPDDYLQITIKGGVSHNESAVKSERVKASVVRRRLAGRDIGGPRPFGFTKDRRELVESEAELVREGHRLVLGGASTYAVVKAFINSGVPPVHAEHWSFNIVKKVLTRPRNAALAVTADGAEYELTEHPSIVSRDDHEAVVAALSTTQTFGRKPAHLASGGVALCGTCGSPMRYSGQKKSYRCIGSNSGLRPSDGQTHASILADVLDAKVRDAVVGKIRAGELPKRVAASQRELHLIREELADLTERSARIVDMRVDNLITKSEAAAKLRPLRTREDELQARQLHIGSQSALDRMLSQTMTYTIDTDIHSAGLLGARFDALTLDQQRELARGLLSVKVMPGRGTERIQIS